MENDNKENKGVQNSQNNVFEALKHFKDVYVSQLHKRTENGLKMLQDGKLKDKDKELLHQLTNKLKDFNILFTLMFTLVDDINIFFNKMEKSVLNNKGEINKVLMEKQVEIFNTEYQKLKKYQLCQSKKETQK